MKTRFLTLNVLLIMTSISCSSNGQPSDSQVITDMAINKNGLIDAYCVKGKTGERYWNAKDQTWYWDRGVVVKRKANIAGVPDAVVIVQGLARYRSDGATYRFYKFLTTDNKYEGIPAPSAEKLQSFVKDELAKVFVGRGHNIVDVSKIELQPTPWVWHNATSFTAEFAIQYKEIVSNTDVSERAGVFQIRFYRDDINSPIRNLLASEDSRSDLNRTKYTDEEIRQMKSIVNK